MSPRSSPGESPREEYGSPERLRVPLPAPPAPTVTADTETEYGEKIESSDKIGKIEKNEKVEKYEKIEKYDASSDNSSNSTRRQSPTQLENQSASVSGSASANASQKNVKPSAVLPRASNSAFSTNPKGTPGKIPTHVIQPFVKKEEQVWIPGKFSNIASGGSVQGSVHSSASTSTNSGTSSHYNINHSNINDIALNINNNNPHSYGSEGRENKGKSAPNLSAMGGRGRGGSSPGSGYSPTSMSGGPSHKMAGGMSGRNVETNTQGNNPYAFIGGSGAGRVNDNIESQLDERHRANQLALASHHLLLTRQKSSAIPSNPPNYGRPIPAAPVVNNRSAWLQQRLTHQQPLPRPRSLPPPQSHHQSQLQFQSQLHTQLQSHAQVQLQSQLQSQAAQNQLQLQLQHEALPYTGRRHSLTTPYQPSPTSTSPSYSTSHHSPAPFSTAQHNQSSPIPPYPPSISLSPGPYAMNATDFEKQKYEQPKQPTRPPGFEAQLPSFLRDL